jgi:hypothetical protein
MVFAENKFLLRTENGQWNSPTEADKKIIAPTAQVDALKKSKLTQSSNTTGSSNRWAWKAIRPKEREPKKKTVDCKTYHWCPTHEAWTIHSPEQCEGKRGGTKAKTEEKPPD